jgi:Glycine cleavage H-protein
VVYVELPSVGEALAAKDTFGVVESVKTASDVYMPVSGEVVGANETLASEPGLVRTVLVVPGQPRAPNGPLCWTDAVWSSDRPHGNDMQWPRTARCYCRECAFIPENCNCR